MSLTASIKEKIKRYPEVPGLAALVIIYLFLSNFFAWNLAFAKEYLNFSGGSDPYFNYEIIQYILQYKAQLIHTIMLNYPIGTFNYRPPFFHWVVVFSAYVLSPIFGLHRAGYYSFMEFDAVFGALLIIPVYLITKEIFGKKAGLFAALLYTLMPSNLTAGIITDGRMHTPELLFVFLTVYFFEMAISKAKKNQIINNFYDFKSYASSIINYFNENRVATIYGILSGVSLGALIVSWQGYPYIEAIVLIYVVVQLIYNLFSKRPTGYLTYFTTLMILFSFPIGYYYYDVTKMLMPWYYPPLLMGVLIIGFGILINLVGKKPWIITIPVMAVIVAAAVVALDKIDPSILREIVSGDGYFIKTRVYSTIAEAAAPPLGFYIAGFGPGAFLLGIAGVPYIIYRFLKNRKDLFLLVTVFSLVSIYMSLEAARFNITAAPAYAILGGGLIIYFADLIKTSDIKKRISYNSVKRSLKGNIKWTHVAFAVIIVIAIIVPSGMGALSAAVPANNASAVNNQLISSIPAPLRPNDTTILGDYDFAIDNSSQPLAESFAWLATQNTNVPPQDRPAYVSWWDYGFQEAEEGQHPAVADDFQQGYATGGDVLLAQNESQILGIFISRVFQASGVFVDGHFNSKVTSVLDKYFGANETLALENMYKNPEKYKKLVLDNPQIYGNHSKAILNNVYSAKSSVYHALIMGQLSAKYSLATLINAYSALENVTGVKIAYIGVDHGLFPFSGSDPGIFYAPAYLTYTPTYTAFGEVVPTEYYDIFAKTSNGSIYPLNETPATATITGYQIVYTSQFYNTTIYRTIVGYSPSAVNETNGIPGISYGTDYTPMPAFNMSNFELVYYGSLWNPYKDYQAHPNAWRIIPIQQAYTYQQESKGTSILLPPSSKVLQNEDPIIEYFPGANITGRLTLPNGQPVAGAYVTIYDQYGIPHEYTRTNSTGYYHLTGLPGNDTIVFSTGTFNKLLLGGSTELGSKNVTISYDQAERLPVINSTTGKPVYDITVNYTLNKSHVSGKVSIENKIIPYGKITFYNKTYNVMFTARIVDGQYILNDLPPYIYNVSVNYNGYNYYNVTQVNVTDGYNGVNNINIVYDTLNVNVNKNGPLSGYNVKVTSKSYSESKTTSYNGTVTFTLIPGKYNIIATKGTSMVNKTINISSWNESKSVTLSPGLKYYISGSAPANSTVEILKDGSFSNVINVTSNGKYNVSLPPAIYTIYYNDSGKAFARTVNLTSNMVVNIVPEAAYRLNISSKILNHDNYTGYYSIIGNNVYLKKDYSNVSYNITLPAGEYYVSGVGTYVGATRFNYSKIDLTSNTSLNLNLTYKFNSTILLTSNNDVNQEVENGIAIVYYNGNPVTFNNVVSSKVTLGYPGNNSYVKVISPYLSGSMDLINNTSIVYSMKQITFPLNVYIYNGTEPVYGNIILTSSNNTYNETLKNGSASFNVAAGVYHVGVYSNKSYISLINTSLVIPYNDNFTSNSELHFAIHSNVTISAFKNGSKVNINYLSPGEYTLYAQKGNESYLSSVYVNSNMTIKPVFVKSYKLSLNNTLNTTLTYYIKSGNKTISTEKPVYLPEGNYTVSLNRDKYVNSTGAYIISGHINIDLNNNTNVTLITKSVEVKSTLFGKDYYNETAIAKANIYIYKDGKLVAKEISNSTGNFEFSGSPGNYTIYAVSPSMKYAYISSFELKPFENMSYNAYMVSAYKLYIFTYLNNKTIYNNVNITENNAYINVNSSRQIYVLPEGTYNISSNVTSEHLSSTNVTINVTYSASHSIFLNKTQYVNLYLSKINVYDYSLKQITPEKNVTVNQTVTYRVKLTNLGNTNSTVELYSGNSTWSMNFSINNFTLAPGMNKTFDINVTVPSRAPAGVNFVPVNVNYTSGNMTAGYLKFNVSKHYGFELIAGSKIVDTIANGNVTLMPVTVSNTGNTPINVTLNITNNNTLFSIDEWHAYILYNGKYVNNITVPYNSNVTFYVKLVPVTAHPDPDITVNLESYYNSIYQNETLKPLFQNVTVSVTGKGNNVLVNYNIDPYTTIYYGITIILIALIVGLAVSTYRSRKKR